MEEFDYWRLCDELSVIQAALLIVGADSAEADAVEGWAYHMQPHGYQAARTALTNAILSGKLSAIIRRRAWERGWDEQPGVGERFSKTVHIFASDLTLAGFPDLRENLPGDSIRKRGVIYRAEPDWHLTTVHVDDLRAWLSNRGLRSGFFFPNAVDAPDYLDPYHPRYAPKLAAAVKAWLATGDESLTRGRSPKQALTKWLREHAADFGLTDDEGKINETGVEETSKVANWQPGGGAPRTPVEEPTPPLNPQSIRVTDEEPEDIPF